MSIKYQMMALNIDNLKFETGNWALGICIFGESYEGFNGIGCL